MFAVIAAAAVMSLVFGIVVDSEFYRLANTCANFATVALIVWHQRHIRKQIEPEVKETAAVVKRQLGERDSRSPDEKYVGPDRRK